MSTSEENKEFLKHADNAPSFFSKIRTDILLKKLDAHFEEHFDYIKKCVEEHEEYEEDDGEDDVCWIFLPLPKGVHPNTVEKYYENKGFENVYIDKKEKNVVFYITDDI